MLTSRSRSRNVPPVIDGASASFSNMLLNLHVVHGKHLLKLVGTFDPFYHEVKGTFRNDAGEPLGTFALRAEADPQRPQREPRPGPGWSALPAGTILRTPRTRWTPTEAARPPSAGPETFGQCSSKISAPAPVAEYRRPFFAAPATRLTWPGPGFSVAPRAASR